MNQSSNDDQAGGVSDFQNAMHQSGVTPLAKTRILPERPKPKPSVRFSKTDDQHVLNESMQTNPDESPHAYEPDEECRKNDLRPDHFRKLKRGSYPIQSSCDLHGLTVGEAKREILNFVDSSAKCGHTCVEIIHGKGNHSKDNVPKLKELTYQLLIQSQFVLGYCRAKSNSGATHILLRRSKNR